jgi:hypothetical protein
VSGLHFESNSLGNQHSNLYAPISGTSIDGIGDELMMTSNALLSTPTSHPADHLVFPDYFDSTSDDTGLPFDCSIISSDTDKACFHEADRMIKSCKRWPGIDLDDDMKKESS